jgi:hypothetical protein
MLCRFLVAVFAIAVFGGSVLADEINGKVKKVDAEKNTIVITVEKKDMTVDVDKDAKVITLVGTGKKATFEDVAGGLKSIKTGTDVAIIREDKAGKKVATEIKLLDGIPKRKKKNR